MPKAQMHPHPSHDLKCADCKFWHPAYVDNFAIEPGTNQMAKQFDLIARGINFSLWITMRASQCYRDPLWQLTFEDHYCGHWEAKHNS